MKIALATDWFAPRQGGIESQLLQLATRLSARGHDVHVFTSTPGAATGEGFEIHRLPGALPLVGVALSPTTVAALWRDLNTRGEYDVVHSHVSVISPVAYAAAVRAHTLRLPTVLTFHSVLRHKRHLLRAANTVLDFARNGARWTAVSGVVAAQVRNALDVEVDVLPNGIDTTFWREEFQRSNGRRTLTLVTAMRLHAKKRPRELVRAFARAVRHADLPVSLRIIGDGPERAALEREIATLRASDRARVQLLGWLSPAAVRSEFARADAFVIASRREAFGIAALEALAIGLPVIAMSESGSREFIRDGIDGLLCNDDNGFAAAIRRYISDAELRDRLASASRDLSRYDWSSIVTTHEDVYHRAIEHSAARRAAEA